jgi:hypothetical protein
MPRWSAERRDVPIARDVKTPRKRLTRASQARDGASQAPASFGALLPLGSPGNRSEEGKRNNNYGGAGAAKRTAGGAMSIMMSVVGFGLQNGQVASYSTAGDVAPTSDGAFLYLPILENEPKG